MKRVERPHRPIRKVYLTAFMLSSFLFWWLPSVLFHIAGLKDPLHNWTLWVSFFALAAFIVGYKVKPFRVRKQLPESTYDRCERLAYLATIWWSIPALIVAIIFFLSRSGVAYGTGSSIPGSFQAVLYLHLFVGLLFLGASRAERGNDRKVILASILLILPRLIISLHWGRFFVAQAVIPVAFIAIARGWVRLSWKRVLQLCLIGLIVVFVPSLTRGDRLAQQGKLIQFFAAGSTLNLFQNNLSLNLDGRCPPLLVSLTAQIFPYHELGICTLDVWGEKNIPATLDRILAYNQPGSEGNLTGPGANYILGLYLTGGLAGILIGAFLFGYTNSCFTEWISRRSLYAGIWAVCLTRSLLAPRNTLGYVYERIPSLVLATWAVVLIAYAAKPLLLRSKDSALEILPEGDV